jgi:hypothetical protein
MSHFAKIDANNIVTQVLVIEQDLINTGNLGNPNTWIQTSYNTYGNVHYGQDGNPDGGIALRGNYAGKGYTYDQANDVFYTPKPFPSWTLSSNTWLWISPVEYPNDGNNYQWNETTESWDLLS